MAPRVQLLSVLLLVARCSGHPFEAVLTDGLFPFGSSAGDTEYPKVDDASINIPVRCDYRFYDELYNTFYLGTNGYITFGESFTLFIPRPLCNSPVPMIAPAWSDVDISPYASGQIFYREDTSQSSLYNVSQVIDAYFNEECGCGFQAQCAFIATWSYVEPFCDFYIYGRKRRQVDGEEQSEEEMKEEADQMDPDARSGILTNTFQTVYVTDDARKSYVIFLYNNMQWSSCWDHNRAGFSPGAYASDPSDRCVELPYSGEYEFTDIQFGSNVGIPGVYMYRVDGHKSKKRIRDPDCEKIGGCCN